MQSKETTTETDSTSVAAPHGEDHRDVHRPDAIPACVDETQILQSGEQAVGAGMSDFSSTDDREILP